MTKTDVYSEVTDRIIAALEEGTVPWRKPWKSRAGVDGLPVNIRTGRPYRGVNVFLLALQGYDDPRWGTFKAIKECGGHVRKGEKGTRVILWKPVRPNEEQAENGRTPYLLLREYTVFNAAQCDGLPELETTGTPDTPAFEANERADAIVANYRAHGGPGIFHEYRQAFYRPSADLIGMPPREDFVSPDGYYCTLFHELTHSTGHEKRLGRVTEWTTFGSDPYAREELVAEMGAAMLAGLAGLDCADGEQSAAYIAGWLKALKNDRKLVVQAAAQAQKAADLIAGDVLSEEDVPAEALAA